MGQWKLASSKKTSSETKANRWFVASIDDFSTNGTSI